jgi:hypothetical protein
LEIQGGGVRLFKLRAFARFQRREGIADKTLAKAVRGAEDGLVDADLGGGLIKQRVARPGQGKRGGFRTIVVYRRGRRAVFCLALPRANGRIRTTMNWPNGSASAGPISGWTMRDWKRPSPPTN